MTWQPTHEVPANGLQAYAAPDPASAPITTLSAGIRLQRIEELGAWARVEADNGWTGWVDGRLLVAAAAPAAAPPPVSPAPSGPAPEDYSKTIVGGAIPSAGNPSSFPSPGTAAPPPGFSPVGGAPAAPPFGAPAAPSFGTPPPPGFGAAPGGPAPFGSPGSTPPPGFSPGTTTTAAASTGLGPLQIAAAVLGLALVVTYLLPWVTFGGDSNSGFTFTADGRDVLDFVSGRSKLGIYLMQLLYAAVVLGPVSAVLHFAKQPAAKAVGIIAGIVGLVVVVGRFLIDLGPGSGFGLGTWLGLLVSAGLIGVSLAAPKGSTASSTGGW